MWNKQSWTAKKGWSSSLGGGVVEGITTPHRKKKFVQKLFSKPRNWADCLIQPWQTNKEMRISTWNVLSLYRTGAVIVSFSGTS